MKPQSRYWQIKFDSDLEEGPKSETKANKGTKHAPRLIHISKMETNGLKLYNSNLWSNLSVQKRVQPMPYILKNVA